MKGFIQDINHYVEERNCHREVLATGEHAQIVINCIPRRGELGTGFHDEADQVIYVLKGKGKLIVEGMQRLIERHDMILIRAKDEHNIINIGDETMKIVSIFTHPEYLHNTIHQTKEESDNEELECEDYD